MRPFMIYISPANKHKANFFDKVLPYLVFGMLGVVGIVLLFAMLFISFWGALAGLIIYGLVCVKNKLFTSRGTKRSKSAGRIIDCHDYTKN